MATFLHDSRSRGHLCPHCVSESSHDGLPPRKTPSLGCLTGHFVSESSHDDPLAPSAGWFRWLALSLCELILTFCRLDLIRPRLLSVPSAPCPSARPGRLLPARIAHSASLKAYLLASIFDTVKYEGYKRCRLMSRSSCPRNSVRVNAKTPAPTPERRPDGIRR